MVGFMHFARSPRHVDLETLQALISQARGRVETCVVLVNPDNSCVMEVAALSPRLDPAAWPRDAASRRGHPRRGRHRHHEGACRIGTAEDVAHVADFADVADRILLDAKPPKGAERPGGLGVAVRLDAAQGA